MTQIAVHLHEIFKYFELFIIDMHQRFEFGHIESDT